MRPDDHTPQEIDAIMEEGTSMDEAMRLAAWDALKVHKQSGFPLAVWRNGKATWISPEDFERELVAAEEKRKAESA